MYTPVAWPVPDLVALAADRVPDGTALVDADTGHRWTYRALSAGPVAAVAAGLRRAGVAPGDRLGLLTEPGPDVAHLVHATARLGAVFVPLDPNAPVGTLRARCQAAGVDRVVVGDVGTDAAPFNVPVETLDALAAPDEAPPEGAVDERPWAPDDVQWLVFTSGTTGDPKPVEITARNLVASATASALRLGVDPKDRWLACLPTHHVGGLAPLVRTALYGTAAVVQAGFEVSRTRRAIREHDVTAISLVPTMLRRLLVDGWTPPDAMRYVLVGGAPTPPDLVDRCASVGVPVCPTYGMTETASQVATCLPDEARDHPGTVGRPLVGTSVTVLDETGEAAPTGEVGRLVIDGPTVAAGYHGDPAATAERFTDGGFRTRDRGRRDADGRLWVHGRLDDAILSGGETVLPARVEAVLTNHPSVAEAVVVGLDDDEWGEVVAALVAFEADVGEVDDEAEALRAHCRDRLETAAVPRVVATVPELPRTASGTVDRGAVHEVLVAARDRGGV